MTRSKLLIALAALLVPLLAPAGSPVALPREVRARMDAERPLRTTQAERALTDRRAQLGLLASDTFSATDTFTDEGGRTVVRLAHLHAGHRVWGSQAVAHVEPDGRVRTFTHGLAPGIVLDGAPRLGPASARAAALRHLAAKGALLADPTVERIVFPVRFRGNDAEGLDALTGRPAAARGSYAAPRARTRPYLWAYEVRTRLRNALDGASERSYVVDGDTGTILRVTDLLQRVAPATGSGRGFYRGTVSLDTSRMDDGTYALYDTTRGTSPCPDLASYQDDGTGWSATGMQVWWEQHDAQGQSTYGTFLFQGNATNTWGDGLAFTAFGDEGSPNGQTAGVDAMAALRTTWDFYGKVFERDGIDAAGTTVSAVTLGSGWVEPDNAWWTIGGKAAYLGVGTWPADPDGIGALTDLDVVAHELSHGVTSVSYDHAWVNSPDYEESGLNEGSSDFLSQMVKIWAARAPADPDDSIPDAPGDWQIGASANRGTPLRWLDRPSLDGRSVDGWYDGMGYLDGHFSSGPLSRAMFFLARGASAASGAADHSPYLPAGMAGVGNEAAARIWYRVVTEYLIPDGTGAITFADAREAALQAAGDLYGAGSTEAVAVENAFAAINVGNAHGQGPRVKVWFKHWRNGDYIERTHFTGYGNRQNLPRGENVRPRITVENAPSDEVTWTLGGPSMWNGAPYFVQRGGRIEADGSWTTPHQMGWHVITATSVADPTQRAEGRAFLVNLDTDQDLEQDATDMAGISYSWYLTNGLNPSHSVYIAPWVDDADVAVFVDALKAAWPAP